MKLTVDQALQQAIAAHKENGLQEAERLYRSVLKVEQNHPVANHNLGLIALLIDKHQEALQLFKTAVRANPKVENFWISYIDTLIKENQLEEAAKVLTQGRVGGVNSKKLNILSQKILSKKRSPSQSQLKNLLNHYQKGSYDEAERLAKFMAKEFPVHQFAWKVLGSIFVQTDRPSEALGACQKAIELSPQDSGAHNNLGTALQNLGRLEEAELSYKYAILLEPNFAGAHYNLGHTLLELSRLHEAEASLRKAIALRSDYAAAHSNLGNTLIELDRLEEAEASYRQAIAVKFDYAEAHYNLANILHKLGRLEEAGASFRTAISIEPNYDEAKHLLASLDGQTTASAPLVYVERLFDGYASKFEQSLVKKLGYEMPKIIADVILKNHSGIKLGSILDLGCGTGLAGLELREHCTYLEGIDLSNRMLEKAKSKNIYDKLSHADILNFLLSENLNFNYFISADVFLYVGDLSEVFKLIKSRNKSAGKLVFSTEHVDDNKNFFLEKSGRYSHSKAYINSLCKQFNYTLSHFEIRNLRKEKGVFLNGGLYILDF